MNPEFRFLTALCALALAHAAAAAPTLSVRRAPTGLTIPQLQQKLTTILQARQQEQATQQQQASTQLKNALTAIDAENKVLSAALARDPRYAALMDQASRISASKGDAATRAAQMKALFTANRVVFNDAIRNAGISAAALQSRVGGAIVKPDLGIQLKAVPTRKTGVLSIPSAGAASSIPDLVLQPPYDFESTDTHNGGLAYSAIDANGDVDHGTSQVHATVIGVAGQASGSADVGQSIDVPDGVTRVEVTVSMKLSWSGSALSVLGLGAACTSAGIELWTSDLGDRLDSDGHFECTMAPIGWYSEMSGDETRDEVFTANISNSAARHLVLLGDTYANGTGGGTPGYGQAESHAQIVKIRVHFIR